MYKSHVARIQSGPRTHSQIQLGLRIYRLARVSGQGLGEILSLGLLRSVAVTEILTLEHISFQSQSIKTVNMVCSLPHIIAYNNSHPQNNVTVIHRKSIKSSV